MRGCVVQLRKVLHIGKNSEFPIKDKRTVMDIKDVTIDPELESFLPPLVSDERKELKAQIERDGFTDPLIVWQNHGDVIDGHNRYRIWQELGSDPDKAPEIIEKKFADKAAVMEWMYKRQDGRRNWTAAQKTMVALKMKPAIEERAKNNKVESGKATGRGNKKVSPTLAKPLDTREEIAKLAGVSHGTVSKVEAVLAEGTPEVKAAMESGEISANAAYKATKGKPSAGPSFNPAEFDDAVQSDEPSSTDSNMPKHLVQVLEGVKAYKSLQREVSLLYGKVETLAKEPVGSYIQLQEVEQHIKQVKADLKAYSFGDNCPTCQNKPAKSCQRCKGRGWLAHAQMGQLSDIDKAWLKENSVKP